MAGKTAKPRTDADPQQTTIPESAAPAIEQEETPGLVAQLENVSASDVESALTEAIEPAPAAEQDLAAKLSAKMRAEEERKKRRAIEAEDSENLWWIQCRKCSQPGAFFDRNPSRRFIRLRGRYDMEDDNQVGLWNTHKSLRERQMTAQVQCQNCDQPLDFLHSGNEMRPYQRFIRRTPKSSLK